MGQLAEVSLLRLAWRLVPWALLLTGVALVLRRRDGSAEGSPVAPPGPPVVHGPPPVVHGPPAPPVRAPRPRPFLGPLTWCVVLVVCSFLGIVAAGGNGVASPGVIAAVALLLFGGGLLLSAFVGRARGLLVPATILAAVLAGLGVLDLRADVTGMPYDHVYATEASLPTHLSSAVGSSSVDLHALALGGDRHLRIDQFAGRLTIVLPTSVDVRLEVRTSLGRATLQRPSRGSTLWSDADLARRWATGTIPDPGDVVDAEVLDGGYWRWSLMGGNGEQLTSGLRDRATRRFRNGSEHTLHLEVRMGVGEVQVLDPHWADDGQRLLKPAQLCTVGGGPRGVVKPCSDVAVANRVALCMNENGYLVDCREDREGTPDWPRVAACRGFTGGEQPCAEVGIDPEGAELVGPDRSPPDPPEDGSDGSATTDTIAPPTPTSVVSPTVASTIPSTEPSDGGAS